MKLNELRPAEGSVQERFRKGRGPGSGNGKTAGKVLLKPAAPGTGIIAGSKVRMVLEAAGIHNIRAKCLRSNNPINVVKATLTGLSELRTVEQVANTRGITADDVKGGTQK